LALISKQSTNQAPASWTVKKMRPFFGREEDCKRLSKYTDRLMYCFFLRNIASLASIKKGWGLIGRKGLKEGVGEEMERNTCYKGSLSLRKQLFLLALLR